MPSRKGLLSRRAALVAFAGAALALSPPAAAADNPAAAVAPVRAFYDVLLDTMKNGQQLGFAGRRDQLAPAIRKFFNFRLMTRLMVGPQWASLTPQQQQQIVAAFSAFSIATYSNRFDGYSGERFDVDGTPLPGGNGDQVVKSQLVQANGEPVELDYLMHDDGGWQAIDVYLSGTVSELATRRSEFSSVLRRGGADALVDLLQRRTAQLSG